MDAPSRGPGFRGTPETWWLGRKADCCVLWATTESRTSLEPEAFFPRDFFQGKLEEGGIWKILVTIALRRTLGTTTKMSGSFDSGQEHSPLAICKCNLILEAREWMNELAVQRCRLRFPFKSVISSPQASFCSWHFSCRVPVTAHMNTPQTNSFKVIAKSSFGGSKKLFKNSTKSRQSLKEINGIRK